ncbi:MAG: hypothetical protein LBQ84_00040 [Flavobacteriaceae bacterium]|jgi:hypothetical protein|nr:hypothetical protein [Flavobacteriaceae bacterium]
MKTVVIFLLFTTFTYSQTRTLDARIIKINHDTINVKMRVDVNLFKQTLLIVTSFNKRIRVIDDSGKKKKIQAKLVKELSFTDFDGNYRRFVGYKNDNDLKEILHDGKIKWYRSYYSDIYGGLQLESDILTDEQNNIVNVGAIGWKKKFREMIQSKLSLQNVVITRDNILMIVNKYDEDDDVNDDENENED